MDAKGILEIYSGMIAGAIPRAAKIDPRRSIGLICQDVLETSSIHVLMSEQDGFVYYMAVPSRLLSSMPNFATPLAAALPGNPDHQGDGAYLLQFSPYAAAIIRRGPIVRLLCSYTGEVMEAIRSEGLPIIEVDPSRGAPMRSQSMIYRAMTTKAAEITATVSAWVLVVNTMVFVVASGVSAYASYGGAKDIADLVKKANETIGAVSMTQPLTRQLNQLTTMSSAVVRTGGWIEGYEFSKKEGERYSISLPAWVTPDVIRDLGPGAITEVQSEENLIWVTKRNLKGESVKAKGASDVDLDPPAKDADAKNAKSKGAEGGDLPGLAGGKGGKDVKDAEPAEGEPLPTGKSAARP